MSQLKHFSAVLLAAIIALILFDPPRVVAAWGASASAGSAVVGGKRVSCGKGKVIWDKNLPDLGMAAKGTIWLNPKLLRRFPASFQQFVFLHECAHQYTFSETDADCWAVKRGVYRGLFSKRNINRICKIMNKWQGGLFHNAGPARCVGIKQCYANSRKPSKSKRRAAIRKKP